MITFARFCKAFSWRRHVLTSLVIVAACGSDGSTGPGDEPPVITVAGVQDGQSYSGAVTISISTDRGSYEATLNGATILSGATISTPGSYTLAITARNGLETATKSISFTILGPAGGTLIVRLLNLGPNSSGPGDAILISDSSAAGMVHAMIDAGPATPGGDSYVANRLDALNVDTLQFLLLTHAHEDHFRGMVPVLNSVRVRRFFYSGQVRSLSSYQSVLSAAQSRADSVIIVRDTIALPFGRASVQSAFTVIPPLMTWINTNTSDGDELNEGSLGTSLRRASFEMYFTGDGEVLANNRWLTTFPQYTRNIDVLKVGHHGANNAIFDIGASGASTWLDHTAPTVAVISANGTSHPRLNALTRILERTNRRTYCTSVHGEITIRIAPDGTYAVTPEKGHFMDCVPGSEATT